MTQTDRSNAHFVGAKVFNNEPDCKQGRAGANIGAPTVTVFIRRGSQIAR